MILPPFFHFLAHVTLCALSSHATYPYAPVMRLQIMGLILTYIALTCIILFTHALVWFLMAMLWLPIMFLSAMASDHYDLFFIAFVAYLLIYLFLVSLLGLIDSYIPFTKVRYLF